MAQKTNPTIFQLSPNNSEWDLKYPEYNSEHISLFLYKTLKIKEYINHTLELQNFWVTDCKIEYQNNKLQIYISFFQKKNTKKNDGALNEHNSLINIKQIKTLLTQSLLISLSNYNVFKSITITTKNLNKNFLTNIVKSKQYNKEFKNLLRKLKRFFRKTELQEHIYTLFIVSTTKNSSILLAKSIKYYFTQNKKGHNFFLSFLKKSLIILINSSISKIKGIKIVIKGRLNGKPRSNKTLIRIGMIPLQSLNNKIDYSETVAYTKNGTLGIKVWIAEKFN